MKELQKFEELRQALMKIMQRENNQIPSDIMKIIEQMHQRLAELYASKWKYSQFINFIQEYSSSNFSSVRATLNRKNGETRSVPQLEELDSILSSMKRGLEEVEVARERGTDEELLQEEERGIVRKKRESINGLDMHSTEMIKIIRVFLEDSLSDIRNKANRRLAMGGFSEMRIHQINSQAKTFIERLVDNGIEKMQEGLSSEDRRILNCVLKAYDEYARSFSTMTRHQKFVEGYRLSSDYIAQATKAGEGTDNRGKKPVEVLRDDYII